MCSSLYLLYLLISLCSLPQALFTFNQNKRFWLGPWSRLLLEQRSYCWWRPNPRTWRETTLHHSNTALSPPRTSSQRQGFCLGSAILLHVVQKINPHKPLFYSPPHLGTIDFNTQRSKLHTARKSVCVGISYRNIQWWQSSLLMSYHIVILCLFMENCGVANRYKLSI